jgi:arylformamidase
MPIEATVVPCRVLEIKDKEAVKVEEIEGQRIRAGERILFKTPNSRRSWKSDAFDENFVYISKEAAAFLARAKVMTVGVDYLSVGGFHKDGVETHQALLGAGIWVIEGLNLAKVKPGRYELACLPLKVLQSDGAPARAVLRKL